MFQTINQTEAHFYGYDLHLNDEVNWKDKGQYATRLFTDRAVNLIKEHDSNTPLFMYFSHLASHTGSSEGSGLEIPDDLDVNKTFPYIKDYNRRLYAGKYDDCTFPLARTLIIVIDFRNYSRIG